MDRFATKPANVEPAPQEILATDVRAGKHGKPSRSIVALQIGKLSLANFLKRHVGLGRGWSSCKSETILLHVSVKEFFFNKDDSPCPRQKVTMENLVCDHAVRVPTQLVLAGF